MNPLFFPKQSGLRKWFEKNYKKEIELWLGFYKKDSGKPSVTWPESVDVALCFGWIDGIRKSLDNESYVIRFTPRKLNSIWSAVNLKKIEVLLRLELMKPEGLAIYNNRKEKNAGIYAYERDPILLDKNYQKIFKANKKAWKFFLSQVPSYQKTAIKWVMTAKREETRMNRLHTLIRDCEAGRKIKPLSYGGNTSLPSGR